MSRTIKQNRWDNWYGYVCGIKVKAFCNTPTGTAVQHAEEWLAQDVGPWRPRIHRCVYARTGWVSEVHHQKTGATWVGRFQSKRYAMEFACREAAARNANPTFWGQGE